MTASTDLTRLWTGVNAKANAGKAVASVLGYTGRHGGWIYRADGTTVCQGYASLAFNYGLHYVADEKGWRLSGNGLAKVERILQARARRAAKEA